MVTNLNYFDIIVVWVYNNIIFSCRILFVDHKICKHSGVG